MQGNIGANNRENLTSWYIQRREDKKHSDVILERHYEFELLEKLLSRPKLREDIITKYETYSQVPTNEGMLYDV